MIWTDFASLVSLLVNAMGNVFETMDLTTLVTLPNAYDFTLLDVGCAFIIYEAMADLITEL